ncbi:MAG TPA: anti-sigma factor [Intrasporangium sp.]|uniref:anti-sigma factor n=1 Tax=Intrasporangium sp. TaxID=1925024 RepID=UPI002D78B10C|nr:anti-sigma factor [Intrasporangium sp.]HET7399146.1 anti-sigma factor [Intrasporangium sp.]
MNDDIHALSGAYAVDALDDVERARFERHLVSCPACEAEVADLSATAGELSAISVQAPPPSLRARVLRDITTVRPLPPEAPRPAPTRLAAGDAPVAGPTRRPGPWRLLVAAAAAAVLVIGGFAAWRAMSPSAPPPSVASQVLDASDASRVVKTLPGGARATLVRSPSLHRAVVLASGMPPAPAGRVYQLWLQDPSGHMAPAGFLPASGGAGDEQVTLLTGDASTAKGAGITVEPAGGSPQPTSAPIVLFAFS